MKAPKDLGMILLAAWLIYSPTDPFAHQLRRALFFQIHPLANLPVTLQNTIVAGNFQGPAGGTTADDVAGTLNSGSSFNLIGTGGSGGLVAGVKNNQVGVTNPGLPSLE